MTRRLAVAFLKVDRYGYAVYDSLVGAVFEGCGMLADAGRAVKKRRSR